MKTSAKGIYAKKIAFKVAIIENETTFKEVAAATDSSYQTIVQIATGKAKTSELRAKAIANVLNRNLEDLFEVE